MTAALKSRPNLNLHGFSALVKHPNRDFVTHARDRLRDYLFACAVVRSSY